MTAIIIILLLQIFISLFNTKKLHKMAKTLIEITAQVKAQGVALSTIGTNVSDIGTNVAGVTSDVASLKQTIADLIANGGANEAELTELATAVDGIDTQIAEIGTSVDAIEATTSDLDSETP